MTMTVRIPMVDLDALHRPLRDELLRAVARCIDGQSFILGEEVASFERAIALYCECPFAIGVSSGTDALLVSLMAIRVGPGDEVVVPAYSFFATAGVVSRLGARPIFVDIDEETCNLDAALLEGGLSSDTKAVIPVHLYGQSAELGPILELAARRSVAVIEDAAQAIGARYRNGRRLGTLGVIGTFSFYPSKNLGALGDAGLVVTSDERLADSLKRLRTHGGSRDYHHEIVGGNFRIDALQAAMLAVKLVHLDDWIGRRRERARFYDLLFDESRLGEDARVLRPVPRADHVYHQYVIRADRREDLRRHLADVGIATAVYYPVPLHLQPCFRELGYARGDFPVAERASEETLALPMYPDLTEEQQRTIVSEIARFYSDAAGG
jgi:dTDP-4-amino-4,6-dideoxygalactose transaminase